MKKFVIGMLVLLGVCSIQLSYASSASDVFSQLFSGTTPSSSTTVNKTNASYTQEIDTLFEALKNKLAQYSADTKIEMYKKVEKKINTLLLGKQTTANRNTLTYLKGLIQKEVENLTTEKGLLKDLFGDKNGSKVCASGYIYIDGKCQSTEQFKYDTNVPKRSCTSGNGYGNQFWYGNYWSKCYITNCNSGYYLSNDVCVNNNNYYYNYYKNGYYYSNNYYDNNCGYDQHYEDNRCVSNTKSCTVTNGYGVSNWYGSYRGNCSVTSCNNGYYLSGGSCVWYNNNYNNNNRNYNNNNCYDANMHRENGNCVANTRSCTVNNGNGIQYWNGNYWESCYANSCNSGYYLSNGSCVKNATLCANDQHREGDYCVSNTRSCSVNNGNGTQYWNGNYWENCYATSCYNGYTLSNGECVSYYNNGYYNNNGYYYNNGTYYYDSSLNGYYNNGYYYPSNYNNYNNGNCGYDQHLENGYCVSNTRSCSISNGYGTQNWNGSYWSDCYNLSCYYGYYLYNGTCARY